MVRIEENSYPLSQVRLANVGGDVLAVGGMASDLLDSVEQVANNQTNWKSNWCLSFHIQWDLESFSWRETTRKLLNPRAFHAVAEVPATLFKCEDVWKLSMSDCNTVSKEFESACYKRNPNMQTITIHRRDCYQFSCVFQLQVIGVVGISVFSLYPWVGVVVIAIGWVFVFISPINCSSSCSSLFEDAAKYDDEKKKTVVIATPEWNRPSAP